MVRFPQALSYTISISLLIALNSGPMLASQVFAPQQQPTVQKNREESENQKDKQARKAERRKQANDDTTKEASDSKSAPAKAEETVEIVSDKQSKNGDLFLYEGYVNA